MEFKSWLAELLESTQKENNTTDKYAQYEIVTTEKQFAEWIKKLEQAELFAFDTETTVLIT